MSDVWKTISPVLTQEKSGIARGAPNSVLWGRRGVYATGLRVIESCTSITS